jgi:hypothetical protein
MQHCSILKVAFNLFFKPVVSRTMLNLCGIVAAILKMVAGRNFSMSGINSEHHNLPTYEMASKSDNVEFETVLVLNNPTLLKTLWRPLKYVLG